MGITVHYRGSIVDLEQVEDFEDRVLDLAIDVGASAQIWRSADDEAARIVRGLILDLSPGQEPTSLLLSPEGWLISCFDIEAAERGELHEPPWCFVKTQYGSVDGHILLIELLDALKQRFFPDLEVSDEGSYWSERNVPELIRQFDKVQRAIDGLADAIQSTSLSNEAREDPQIVMARVERLAQQVHQTLARPPEHPPVQLGDDESLMDFDGVTEAEWDASHQEQRRQRERMHRAVEERILRGDDIGDAMENALRDEAIIGLPDDDDDDGFDAVDVGAWEVDETEPWRESLSEFVDDADEQEDVSEADRHPLQRLASDLRVRLYGVSHNDLARNCPSFDVALRGVGDTLGGLAQALGSFLRDVNGLSLGLSLGQLKRALRGNAFVKGALFPLRSEGIVSEAEFEELRTMVEQLEDGILAELDRVRRQMEAP